jgi:peptide/nickel transport system ATP-binding protein
MALLTETSRSAAPLLEIENLRVWFGATEVVRGVSLTLHRGEVLGLVGESGSGKSVTSLAILGLLSPAARLEGSIRWQGRELLSLTNRELRSIRGREIAMVFQEPMTALNPVMPVGHQIAEAILAHSHSKLAREARQQAIQALESVAIPDAARRYSDYPHQFSGGQRQRILIAMALVHKPKLLIADEPTTALDVTVQAQVLELLKSLQREHDLAMLFTSHDLAVVGQMANRVAVMRHGQILESGPSQQVLTQPQHPYTKGLLAAVPTLRTDRNAPLAMVSDRKVYGAPTVDTSPAAGCAELPFNRA